MTLLTTKLEFDPDGLIALFELAEDLRERVVLKSVSMFNWPCVFGLEERERLNGHNFRAGEGVLSLRRSLIVRYSAVDGSGMKVE